MSQEFTIVFALFPRITQLDFTGPYEVLSRLPDARCVLASVEGGELVGKRPALGDSVYVDVGWSSEPRLALVRSGTFEPRESGGSAEIAGAIGTLLTRDPVPA